MRYDDTPYLDPSGPLTALEIACGMPLAPMAPRPAPTREDPGLTGRQALEAEVLRHLAAGPVSVSFSGGRDSSLVLAVACHVARREGLPLPRAVTLRHPSKESDERDWQELVIGHLRVAHWDVMETGDSMDVLGDAAAQLLPFTGVLSPPNAYLHLPLVTCAGEGTLLTGGGGDEVLGTPAHRLARVLARFEPARPRDLATMAMALSPRPVRRAWHARQVNLWAPWLRPPASREARLRVISDDLVSRWRWDEDLRSYARGRWPMRSARSLDAVGASVGVRIASPLFAPSFVDALARDLGVGGPLSRTDIMRSLAYDLLPAPLIERRTKAAFGAMVWGPKFRSFVERWDGDLGAHVDPLVDHERLLDNWRQENPSYQSMMLVQHAWIRQQTSA